jgi:hypothetical protein
VADLRLVRSMCRATLLLLFALFLSGCTPGLVFNLYNATGESLRITNPPFRRVVTIPPDTAADVAVSGDVLVRSGAHSWRYSPGSIAPPAELFEKHGILWRAFGKIDSRGYVSVRVPAGQPQPVGFPAKPRKT